MKTLLIRTKDDLRTTLARARKRGARIGLVPTMGALHAGHGVLMTAALDDCDFVVVSIFVNPTQFAAGEDLARYPRDLSRDLDFVAQAGAQAVFAPTVEELYGRATEPLSQTTFDIGDLARVWEGALRPTHFAGVALVVAKLLMLVGPDCAWFGEKDYQQLCVVRQLVRDLDIACRIVGVPTVREADGLALSSRNRYLDRDQRVRATALFAALRAAQRTADSGQRDARLLEDAARTELLSQAEAGLEVGYCALVDPATLEPVARLNRRARLLIAATLAGVHLIDNAEVTEPPGEDR